MTNNEYLNNFAEKLERELLKKCIYAGIESNILLTTDDVDDLWLELAQGYLPDALPEIANYPVVSLAWAAFLGMGVTYGWEENWEATKEKPYSDYYGPSGFDDMDENIIKNIVGLELDSIEAIRLNKLLRSLAEHAVDAIRHEQIEPQSSMAFHVFARSCTAMYRIGMHIALYNLGYKMQEMPLPNDIN